MQTSADEFYIIHFNDVYDIEEQIKEPKGGAARFLFVLNLLKSKYKDCITLFSGDIFSPSSLSNIYSGTQMIYPLQQFKIDVACLGNHDFDFPLVILKDLLTQSKNPWLLSNVFNSQTHKNMADALPYYTLQVSNTKIGFLALAEEEWLGQITAIARECFEYSDFILCAEKTATFLRNDLNCEIIVALTHMRIPNDQKLIQSLEPGLIDLVLGGHDHFWHREKISQSLFAKSGTNFRNLGLFRVQINQDNQDNSWYQHLQEEFTNFGVSLPQPINYKLQSRYHNLSIQLLPIDIMGSIPQAPEMQQYVEEKVELYNLDTQKVIAYLDCELDTRFQQIRVIETNAANLFADILRLEFGSDVSFINTGTMRSDELISPGPISYQTIDKIFAIHDFIVSYWITGADLLSTLENGVSKSPSADGRFLGVSGIQFKYSINAPSLSRINEKDVYINGKPLQLDKKYKVVTKQFIADGFDGFKPILQNYIFDQQAGIPIKSVFIQFFETVRKNTSLRKLSMDGGDSIDLEENQYLIDKAILDMDNRYSKFRPIISSIKIVDREPYIVINPKVEGRIQILQ